MFTTDTEFLSDGYRVQFQRVIEHETGEEKIYDVLYRLSHATTLRFEVPPKVSYRLSHATTCRFEVPTKVSCQLSQDVQLNFTVRNRWSL